MPTDRPRAVALTITAESLNDGYGGHDVFLNGERIGHRPYDGSNADEVCDETARALAGMLRERLGWAPEAPKEDEY
jgi:hypothetical protein